VFARKFSQKLLGYRYAHNTLTHYLQTCGILFI